MKNIAIIGIGLIGSSIDRHIRANNKEVIINIVDNSKLELEKSKKLNLGNNYFENISSCKDENEIIFICTPISAYKVIFGELKKIKINDKTIITDVGSSKSEIVEVAQNILKIYKPTQLDMKIFENLFHKNPFQNMEILYLNFYSVNNLNKFAY